MAEEGFKRKLTTIFSADVVGYSRLMEDNEEATIQTLNAYRNSMSTLIQNRSGRVVDMTGDNLMAEFASVVDAVKCAVETQKEIGKRNADLQEKRRMLFRIGVNLGDIVEEDDRIYGDGVNVASRIEGLADPGGVCLSKSAYEQIKKKLDFGFKYMGEHPVKNISEPVSVYKVLLDTESSKPLVEEKLELPDKPSVAVLPFDNLSGDPKQEYFSDGITDQIITSLSIIPRLFVIARNSTFTYKGKAVKVQKVAEELGVRYVVEGSVQRSEKRIRILVQLIDAITGRHLWSERYDRDLQDVFDLQDEIAMQIMTALQVKLTEGEYASGIAGGTSNLKALESFWRAEEHFFRHAEEDNKATRRWAEKAVDLDPNFAGAWALLGFTHLWDTRFGWSESPARSLKQAGECAKKAIALDDSNAKAFGLAGFLQLMQRNHDEALKYGQKAIALNPNDPMWIAGLASVMEYSGRFEESIALVKKAMRLTPYYPVWFLEPLSWSYIFTERYEEAIAAGKLALDRSRKGEIEPLHVHLMLASAYIGRGLEEEAKAHAEEVLKINPNFSSSLFLKAMPYKYSAHLKSRIALYRKAGLPD